MYQKVIFNDKKLKKEILESVDDKFLAYFGKELRYADVRTVLVMLLDHLKLEPYLTKDPKKKRMEYQYTLCFRKKK
jgi:hypothetical protein